MSSVKPVAKNSNSFKKCKNIEGFTKIDEIISNNTYKYLVGEKTKYSEIIQLSKSVRKYYPDAFIVAIKHGKIIPLNDALRK